MMYKIPESWNTRREPRTPVNIRSQLVTFGISFDDQFDWDILFAEVVRVSPEQVLLIGAPLYELKERLHFTDEQGNHLEHRSVEMDRVCITVVRTTSDRIHLSELVITVEDRSTDFAGVPSIMTMQKNEPFHWIRDWIKYHQVEHGVKGFCIYNNNSTDYTTEELRDELSSIEGVDIKVIDWSMPYGPETPYWDADYSRYVMYEAFKYKYGWCSSYCINQDIDELLIVDGGTSDDVYEYLKENGYDSLMYGNRNIDAYNKRLQCSSSELPISERVFKDYYSYSPDENSDELRGNNWSITKWLTIPERTLNYQWKNHDIGGNTLISDKTQWQIYFAHFYPLQSKNQDFKNNERNISEKLKDNLSVDELLKEKLERIF